MTDMSVSTGEHGHYRWLESRNPRQHLGSLIRHCTQVLIGKYLVVTSVDSGPIIPSEEEHAAGWTGQGGLIFSPQLDAITAQSIPSYDFTECYLFTQPINAGWFGNVIELKIFVNYFPFTLRNCEDIGEPSVSLITCEQQQESFWSQINHITPVSYVSDGVDLKFVSRDFTAYSVVKRWMLPH